MRYVMDSHVLEAVSYAYPPSLGVGLLVISLALYRFQNAEAYRPYKHKSDYVIWWLQAAVCCTLVTTLLNCENGRS